MSTPEPLELRAIEWPEIAPGDDLVGLICAVDDLQDGDIAVVTSKVLSKAEGRLVQGDRAAAIADETRRVVARRGPAVIAETRHGLVMAAAGVDASNTPAGSALLLPLDPDGSARRLREGVYASTGLNVGVVVSDTAGRAWRLGQTDMAIGCAGLAALVDLAGSHDTHGNELLVTAPAVADELAAAADLVKGKASGRPLAVVRGLATAVLPPGEHGPGARSLIRSAADDLFGLGTREAVRAAVLRTDTAALAHFPRLMPSDLDPFDGLLLPWLAALSAEERDQLRVTLSREPCPEVAPAPGWSLQVAVRESAVGSVLLAVGRLLERADVLAAAHRLAGHDHADDPAAPEWRLVATRCWQDQPDDRSRSEGRPARAP